MSARRANATTCRHQRTGMSAAATTTTTVAATGTEANIGGRARPAISLVPRSGPGRGNGPSRGMVGAINHPRPASDTGMANASPQLMQHSAPATAGLDAMDRALHHAARSPRLTASPNPQKPQHSSLTRRPEGRGRGPTKRSSTERQQQKLPSRRGSEDHGGPTLPVQPGASLQDAEGSMTPGPPSAEPALDTAASSRSSETQDPPDTVMPWPTTYCLGTEGSAPTACT